MIMNKNKNCITDYQILELKNAYIYLSLFTNIFAGVSIAQ